MSGEPHDSDIDRLIDGAARALTDGVPPAGLVFKVRARVSARRPWWGRAPVWGVAASAAAATALLIALRIPQIAPPPNAQPPVTPSAIASPAPASPTVDPAPAVTSRAAAPEPTAPRRVPAPRASGANGAAPAYVRATPAMEPVTSLAPISPVPLALDAIDDTYLALDAIESPMPLFVERLTLEPLPLSEGDV